MTLSGFSVPFLPMVSALPPLERLVVIPWIPGTHLPLLDEIRRKIFEKP
jgi:hypothetical protein